MRMMRRVIVVLGSVAIGSGLALGQADSLGRTIGDRAFAPRMVGAQGPQAPNDFGPGETNVSIGASAFGPETSLDTFGIVTAEAGRFASGPGPLYLTTTFIIPTGAVLDAVSFEVYDGDAAQDIGVEVFACSGIPPGTPCVQLGLTTSTGSGGWQYVYLVSSGGLVIDNYTNQYGLVVGLPYDGALTEFKRAVIAYHLQVSPAPATATFNDVPTTHPFFQYIEALYASGVTGGCSTSPPLYCPDAPVTRGQMAVFLAKALGLYWP